MSEKLNDCESGAVKPLRVADMVSSLGDLAADDECDSDIVPVSLE